MAGKVSTTTQSTYDASRLWHGDESRERGAAVLDALRRYRHADKDMRARTRLSMNMGETDLAALRFLLREQRADRTVSASRLAEHLGITTASTATLISRLEKSGHIDRRSNPADRRGVFLTATETSDDEVRATTSGMHARMILSAEKLSPEVADGIIEFLDQMTAAIGAAVPDDEGDAAESDQG